MKRNVSWKKFYDSIDKSILMAMLTIIQREADRDVYPLFEKGDRMRMQWIHFVELSAKGIPPAYLSVDCTYVANSSGVLSSDNIRRDVNFITIYKSELARDFYQVLEEYAYTDDFNPLLYNCQMDTIDKLANVVFNIERLKFEEYFLN